MVFNTKVDKCFIFILLLFFIPQPRLTQKRQFNFQKNEIGYKGISIGPSFPYGDF
jgi:hypothetical protein